MTQLAQDTLAPLGEILGAETNRLRGDRQRFEEMLLRAESRLLRRMFENTVENCTNGGEALLSQLATRSIEDSAQRTELVASRLEELDLAGQAAVIARLTGEPVADILQRLLQTASEP
jgi:hypothetical protein